MPGPRGEHIYDDAAIYDILHDDGTDADVRVLERIARRVGALPRERRGTWLEPACGSGRYLLSLARRGHRAIGLDLSEAMVSYARRAAREAGASRSVTVLCAPMERFTSPARAHVACNLINSIRHLGSDRAMREHLACMARALRPGGAYLVGLSISVYGIEQPSEDVWTGVRGAGAARVRVTQAIQYVPPDAGSGAWARRERVISHLTILRGQGARAAEEHRDSTYWLRTYSLPQWREVVRSAGWRIDATFDQLGAARQPQEPGYTVFVLRPGERG